MRVCVVDCGSLDIVTCVGSARESLALCLFTQEAPHGFVVTMVAFIKMRERYKHMWLLIASVRSNTDR